MRHTVNRLGGVDWKAGTKFLHSHPRFWSSESNKGGFKIKMSQAIEQAFRRAWMSANMSSVLRLQPRTGSST